MSKESTLDQSQNQDAPSPNGMVIHSKLLQSVRSIRAGVSSRRGGVSPPPFDLNLSYNVGDDPINVTRNRERFFGSLGISSDDLAVPYQVHSATVRGATKPGRYETCDALVTNLPGIFLAVTVADCLPILLYDPSVKAVAAVHSGWRGSKDRILKQALKTLSEEFGSDCKDVIAFIGPAAGGCCYEVGEEVAREFPSEYTSRIAGRKPRLDLKLFNKMLLLEDGVDERNVEVSPLCTICTVDSLHSYRRDGDRSGRMMGVIGIVK